MNRYAIIVFWSDEDDVWIADVPDLRPCSALGDSPEAAVREVRVAMEAWLDVARAAGLPIPRPQFQPLHAATTQL